MLKHIKASAISIAVFIVSLVVFCSFDVSSVNDSGVVYRVVGNQCYVESCSNEADGEIVIPDTYDGAVVVSVKNGAFKDCQGISSVVLPETIKSIGNEAFSGCSNLNSIVIPDSVIELGVSLFYKCSNLTSVTLPKSITEIPQNTFYYCKKLLNVEIPSSVEIIGKSAFYGCDLLEKVVLSENTNTISDSAFKGCVSLKMIYIPYVIRSIGADAFYQCENLCKVYYSGKSQLPESLSIFSGNECLTRVKWFFEHQHSAMGEIRVIEATCTQDGYSELMCECGLRDKSGLTPATGHQLTDFTTVKQPDCKNAGLVKAVCLKCDYNETLPLPAASHKIVIDEAVDPTCFDDGKTKGSHCYVCGDTIEKQTIIPALGHNYSEKIYDSKHLVSAATYTKEAVYRYSCVRCSAVGSKTFRGNKLILARPSQIVSSSTENSISLKWSKVKNATGYGVYYRNSAKKWILYKKVTTSYIDFEPLPSGRAYAFAVKAYVVENGKTVASPYHQIIIEATCPESPLKIAAKQNETSIKIAWSAVAGASGYRVYGYNTKTNNWIVLRTATQACTHITENLKNGTFYKFAVRPYIDLGTKIVWAEGYAEIVSATKPLAPVLKSTALAGAVKLNWSKVNGADGYVIYGSKRPDVGYVRLKVTTGLECSVSGLAREQTYYFRAVAVKKTNSGYIFSYASDIKVAKTR